jgi:hypothetical protein
MFFPQSCVLNGMGRSRLCLMCRKTSVTRLLRREGGISFLSQQLRLVELEIGPISSTRYNLRKHQGRILSAF